MTRQTKIFLIFSLLVLTLLLIGCTNKEQITGNSIVQYCDVQKQVPITTEIVKDAEWQVDWYLIGNKNNWGEYIGQSKFFGNINKDWGTGEVYGRYTDGLGFIANTEIFLEEGKPVEFYIRVPSSQYDEYSLILDGKYILPEINGRGHTTRSINLAQGKHSLVIYYQHIYGDAGLIFYTTPDVMKYKTTQTTYQTINVREVC